MISCHQRLTFLLNISILCSHIVYLTQQNTKLLRPSRCFTPYSCVGYTVRSVFVLNYFQRCNIVLIPLYLLDSPYLLPHILFPSKEFSQISLGPTFKVETRIIYLQYRKHVLIQYLHILLVCILFQNSTKINNCLIFDFIVTPPFHFCLDIHIIFHYTLFCLHRTYHSPLSLFCCIIYFVFMFY